MESALKAAIPCEFHDQSMMRYSLFVPRLYNLCRSLGFEAGHIMPSRAFCADESQGFPIILIAKHFGTFPFNHGQVGGIVATDRHGPHADHGKDMVIIQASHVGYDPELQAFGVYCRPQAENHHHTTACGKVAEVLRWYQQEYQFAQETIRLTREQGRPALIIDNHLLNHRRTDGLFLKLDKMLKSDEGQFHPLRILSTSKVFIAAEPLIEQLPDEVWDPQKQPPIAAYLSPELFYFERKESDINTVRDQLEENLVNQMPWIVASSCPLLTAAQYNTQAEFDRTFRSLAKAHEYRNKNLLFISCINIDISPKPGRLFPLTQCVPWAAYVKLANGESRTYEQDEIIALLRQQSDNNPDQIDLEQAIEQMIDEHKVRINL